MLRTHLRTVKDRFRRMWLFWPFRRPARGRMAWRLAFLLLILTAFAGWAMELHMLPPWQGPDEPRHFEMVILTKPLGRKPTPADLDTSLQKALIRSMRATHFARYGWLDPSRPVDLAKATTLDEIWPAPAHMFQQPSLYYRLASAWRMVGPSALLPALYWLRVFSLFLGVLSLLTVIAVALKLFPSQPGWAFLVAAFVGWQPMLGQMFAVVDNDVLVVFWATAAYAGMALILAEKWPSAPPAPAVRAMRREARFGRWTYSILAASCTLVGWRASSLLFLLTLIGWGQRLRILLRALRRTLPLRLCLVAMAVLLAIWSKRTGLATLPAFFLLLFWLWIRNRPHRQQVRRAVILFVALIAFMLAGVYFWQRLNPYLQLSPHTAELWQQGAYWQALRHIPYLYYARMLWISYWADFGWLHAPVPGVFYWFWGAWFALALACGIWLSRQQHHVVRKRLWWGSFIALASGVLLVYAKEWLFLSYRVGVVPQGRYLFPEILPMALLVPLGWQAWLERHPPLRNAMAWLWASWLFGFAFFAICCTMRNAFPSL